MDNKHHTSTSKPKNKNKLLKMLPKAMSFGHRVPPFSPGRDHHHNHQNNKMFFSGPMVPLVPNAARVRRNKNDAVWDEPTSPKVSCIGQIKLGKSKCPNGKKNKATASLIPKISKTSSSLTKEDEKGRISKIKRLFSFSPAARGNTTSRKSHPTAVSAADEHPVTVVSAAAVPSLGQMKKFASSRESLGGFDWAVEMKHQEESPADHHRGYYSDDDSRGAYLRDDDYDEDDIIIPFSAPLGLKPKKEVNLWKRRTMDPPKPLHLQ